MISKRDAGIVLAIGNLKGGVGSTTLATNIAAHLQNSGFRVQLLEFCRRRTVDRWCQDRMQLGLPPLRNGFRGGSESTGPLDVSVLDIDRCSEHFGRLFSSADYWLAPSSVSAADLALTCELHRLWHGASAFHKSSASFRVVLTQVTRQQVGGPSRARRYLRANCGAIALRQTIGMSEAWAQSAYGSCVSEMPSLAARRAQIELRALVDQLFNASAEDGSERLS